MSRPPRIEAAGALYHITSRGNDKQDIFLDKRDRRFFLDRLGRIVTELQWRCYAWCLMTNHYHLMIETPIPNLSRGMHRLNGSYSQHFNRRHGHIGHVFQDRFGGIMVEKESHLLELTRYIVLNPVRAGLTRRPENWTWSSYRATARLSEHPDWLSSEGLLRLFDHSGRKSVVRYRRFVSQGIPAPSPWTDVKEQVFLGSEAFIARMQSQTADGRSQRTTPTSRPQAFGMSLEAYRERTDTIRKAMGEAYASGHYTMQEIASHFGVSIMTVSRAVKALGKSKR